MDLVAGFVEQQRLKHFLAVLHVEPTIAAGHEPLGEAAAFVATENMAAVPIVHDVTRHLALLKEASGTKRHLQKRIVVSAGADQSGKAHAGLHHLGAKRRVGEIVGQRLGTNRVRLGRHVVTHGAVPYLAWSDVTVVVHSIDAPVIRDAVVQKVRPGGVLRHEPLALVGFERSRRLLHPR